jgi:NAD(P)-dependent dehydrogenase (short-subunit alcohol dehydrogenase family)
VHSNPDRTARKRVILVTGGGSGIGRATCQLFARGGDAVAILDWNQKAGEETCAMIREEGGQAIFLHADVSIAEQVEGAIEAVLESFGQLDILLANAAVQINTQLEDTTEEDWNRMLAVNLTGTFLCCKAGSQPMRRQGSGCIIICSSGHAFHSYPGYAGYASTKGALLSFMRCAAIDLAPYGIRVNGIIPGATDTPLLRYHFERCPEDEPRLLAKIPLRRLAQPEDIARGVRMLASEDASYVTGTWLAVDGGLLAQG